jgi:hypothetical protein
MHLLNMRLASFLTLLSLLVASHPSRPDAAGQDNTQKARDAWGQQFDIDGHRDDRDDRSRRRGRGRGRHGDAVRRWNEIVLDANALDHTPVQVGEARTFGEQMGPGRTARALAIVHLAMFEAANSVQPRYRSYTTPLVAPKRTSMGVAVAQAAHDTLVEVYPSQAATFDAYLAEDLAGERDAAAIGNGIAVGQKAASVILALRAGDGSDTPEPRVGVDFTSSQLPGFWRPDPVSQIPLAMGAYWNRVTPFAVPAEAHPKHEPPPDLTSEAYAESFDEVKRLGGNGTTTPTERTADQTIAGTYWGYDGTPGLGTPPRLYNQIAMHIANQRGTDAVGLARLLALVNVGMADAAVVAWYEKYLYQTWRPVAGIREADPGTGPTGLGDGNAATIGDPAFTPLGAPASNLRGPNFTPPFPAYPSGHATFGSVLFQTLRRVYGTDRIRFTFVSDEYNGETTDNTGTVRPRIPRTFRTLSAAEEENGQSRIYLGIHWSFDKERGAVTGRAIADYVFEHEFQPLKRSR